MRIGFDGRYIQDQYHGIGRYAFELLRCLVQLGTADQFVVFWNPGLANRRFDLPGLLSHPRVEGKVVRLPLYWPQEQILLPLLAAPLRLDVLHVPYFATPLLTPCPLVLTIHDLIFEQYREYMPQRWAYSYYRALTTLSLRRARAVFAVSAATRRGLQEHYRIPRRRVVVTPEAADPNYRPAARGRVTEVRRRYHLPEAYVLNVGTLRPHKNLATVVRALGRIRDQVPHALVLAGERDPRFPDTLSPLIRELGLEDRIVATGVVAEEDLPALYTGAAVFAFPSLVEGFGLPVLEAMSCGTPVITSNCSSLPEVGGNAALLVDPTDDVAMAHALLQILTDAKQHKALVDRGLVQAASFSWERTARQTLAVYNAIGQRG